MIGLDPEVLACLASQAAGWSLAVHPQTGLEAPVAVLPAAPGLWYDPTVAHLYDVLLAAACLHRGGQPFDRNQQNLPLSEIRLAVGRRRLLKIFPEASGGEGWSNPESPSFQPRWAPIINPTTWPVPFGSGPVSLMAVKATAGSRSSLDLTDLVAAIDRDQMTTAPLPGAEHLGDRIRYVTIPVTIDWLATTLELSDNLDPVFEHYDEGSALVLANCLRQSYRRSSGPPQDQFRCVGTRLSTNRLHQVPASRASGRAPRLFHSAARGQQRRFVPDRHVMLVGWDLNPVSDESLKYANDAREVIYRHLMTAVRAYELLAVRFAVTVFLDRVLPRPGGGHLYFHLPLVIKQLNDNLPTAWRRLAAAMHLRGRLPGEPAAWAPLTLDSTVRAWSEIPAREQDIQAHLLHWSRSPALGGEHPQSVAGEDTQYLPAIARVLKQGFAPDAFGDGRCWCNLRLDSGRCDVALADTVYRVNTVGRKT
ncbi:hypothetical protein LBMAG53_38270 [Planctomycetota bacterium]|nr:hypothetical protein LBMAG53_38270 [Planctomycetota bacterium]